MTTLPNTIAEYSMKAAESFIQTAVFVDDRIYEAVSKAPAPRRIATAPKLRKSAVKSAEKNIENAQNSKSEAVEDDEAPDTYDIVNYFAKKQIVCSLYQPKKNASVSAASEIFPLCKAADVVIIDWDLYGDSGRKALELADGLITQAVQDVPEQLRLILVYTRELNLLAIASEIHDTVRKSVGERLQIVEGEEGLVFRTENSRVAVLGKPGRDRPKHLKRFVVNEKELANVAIREFAQLASGILHAATLLGLAEIRKKSRKILSKFNRDLDPAFLTHFAMSLPDEDASSHVIPLLVSEIEAVLEDALPNPLLPDGLLKDWCENVWEPGNHLDELFDAKGLDYKAIAAAICAKGFKEAKKEHDKIPSLNNGSRKTRKAAKIFLPSSDSDANHRFSHLMASRTFYGDRRRKTLQLGSIVYNEKDSRYSLCIQPVCDSIRLKAPRDFIFVKMNKMEGDDGRASHVVCFPEEPPLELVYEPKSYLCYSATFKPDSSSQEIVAIEKDGVTYFEDIQGNKYHWVDQLKTSHAQRAVERFASDLSRVGLTESEWLRSLEKK
jgi:hypothetical protein